MSYSLQEFFFMSYYRGPFLVFYFKGFNVSFFVFYFRGPLLVCYFWGLSKCVLLQGPILVS